MSDGNIHVTETELWVTNTISGTSELAALDRWSQRFGFLASECPISRPIVRDVERRRIYYGAFDFDKRGTSMDPDDFIRDLWVQLESPPPPWPREIAARLAAQRPTPAPTEES